MHHMEIPGSSVEPNLDNDKIEPLENQKNDLPYDVTYPTFDLDLDEEFDAVRSIN